MGVHHAFLGVVVRESQRGRIRARWPAVFATVPGAALAVAVEAAGGRFVGVLGGAEAIAEEEVQTGAQEVEEHG